MLRYIIVTFEFEGFHHWPKAPKEARHLKYRHRHIFKVKAVKEVYHDDRDVEFQIFKRTMESFVFTSWGALDGSCELEGMSCERLAEILSKRFDLILCEVWEDGENAGCFAP
jgi:hypothetical protein